MQTQLLEDMGSHLAVPDRLHMFHDRETPLCLACSAVAGLNCQVRLSLLPLALYFLSTLFCVNPVIGLGL